MIKILTILLSSTILTLPFYEVHFVAAGIPFSLPEAIALLAIVLGACYTASMTKSELRSFIKKHSLFFIGAVLIVCGAALSTFYSADVQAGLGVLKAWVIAPILFVVVSAIAAQKKPHLWRILFSMYFYSAALVSLVALYYGANDIFTYDGRLQAFYASPNMLALYITPALFCRATLTKGALAARAWLQTMTMTAHSVGMVAIIIVLYLTQSYAAWGALIVAGVSIALITMGKKRWWIVAGIAVCAVFLVVSQAQNEKVTNLFTQFERSSLSSRLMIWRSAAQMVVDHPVVGIGPNQFQKQYLAYQQYYPPYLEWAVPQPHNLYLAFYLQAGLIGLLSFVVLCKYALYKSFFVYKKTPLLMAASGALLVILLHGLFDTPYWKGDLAFVFWLIIATLYFSHDE